MNDITEDWSDWPMWTGLFLGVIGAISSEALPTIWMMIEVNLISFLPILSKQWRLKKTSILYFIVQRVGSLVILSRIISERVRQMRKWAAIGLLLKGRLAPLHFWGAVLVSNISTLYTFIFLTWQKIPPIFIIIIFTSKYTLIFFAIINVMMSAACVVGTKALITLIFFSSMMHMGWMISAPLRIGCGYFVLYVLASLPIYMPNPLLFLLLLNLAGLPPFTGFFMKLRILQFTRMGQNVILLAFSAIVLYAYTRTFLYNSRHGSTRLLTIVSCRLGLVV